MIDMFLKIPTIEGESIDAQHAGEIDVLAYSLGFSNASPPATGSTRATSRAAAQDLSVTVYYTKASPVLFLSLCQGTVFPTATLTLRKAGAKPRDFMVITLEKVTITSDSQGGSGGEDRPTQNFTLGFSRISYSYAVVSTTGEPLPPVLAGFDFGTNSPIRI